GTWGAEPDALARLTLNFDRLLSNSKAMVTNILGSPDRPETLHFAASAFDPVVGDSEALADRVRQLRNSGVRVVVAAEGPASARRLSEVLTNESIDAPYLEVPLVTAGAVSVVVAPIERGVVSVASGIALIAEADLSGRRRVHRKARGARRAADYYDDLKVGDYVVHQVHGVGRFEGMGKRSIGGVERDYLMLAYRGSDRLYVPTDQISTVRRYTGGDSPSLSRMGGAEWQKTRSKVRNAVAAIAAELVTLYRTRLATPGHAFGPDTPWQREMEDAFPYEETPDQMQAIIEVKEDMERSTPMDRLVCGDVGYGKTEIAIRAAFKAVQEGKQVGVLVPTTLLANQHGETFRERFSGFPVRVEVLSRFLTTKEQNVVIEGVTTGQVDIVIGTHRLLSEDLAFKDLGLLIIDEEQRFGVEHKEKIKHLRAHVDVLTLSATPIPRTLEMSLTGIRDLSLVQTPPEERQPILTYVGEYDERAVSEAIRRELLREGQVFYVHNRVNDIDHVAEQIRELVPEARVVIAHGQMDEGLLERTVIDFADRKSDVLVCTTIVESGLDLPMANTLVVDRADLLGLAQLYQLRGRVGRRGHRAYAYLLHPRDKVLSEEAYERLKAIGEFTDLGSGFKLAMRDLEIRGAGNMLGGAQSGHIAAVGFDLYCELVTEAVSELKGERIEQPFEVVLDLPADAHLPRDYVERDDVRMEAYRRLAGVESPQDVDDIEAEWLDRYGPPPAAADALLDAARLRAECVRLRISNVSIMRTTARLVGLSLPESRKVRLTRLAPKSIAKDSEVVIPLDAAPNRVVAALTALLLELIPPEDAAAKS
ncbi:MAG: transcription-repair coupling factor, partial [Actinobacteria bacterium]|nr:transcription-repair coupling factor [Actinomycetota bacterium]